MAWESVASGHRGVVGPVLLCCASGNRGSIYVSQHASSHPTQPPWCCCRRWAACRCLVSAQLPHGPGLPLAAVGSSAPVARVVRLDRAGAPAVPAGDKPPVPTPCARAKRVCAEICDRVHGVLAVGGPGGHRPSERTAGGVSCTGSSAGRTEVRRWPPRGVPGGPWPQPRAPPSEACLPCPQYVAELSLLEADPFLKFLPSLTAAAAYCLANYTVNKHFWVRLQRHFSR